MSYTETLDDFEQSLMRFTMAIEENVHAMLSIIDKEDVPASVADKLMNILIGMESYIDVRSSDIFQDLENHIQNQHSRDKTLSKICSYTTSPA